MIFGTPEFCEVLRRLRGEGIYNMTQVQVLSLLSTGPLTRLTMSELTGSEYNNIKKVVQLLIDTGDVIFVGGGYKWKLYALSKQGRELVDKVSHE